MKNYLNHRMKMMKMTIGKKSTKLVKLGIIMKFKSIGYT